MGLTRRIRLAMMPVMDFEQAGRALWKSVGLSAQKVEQIVRDHELEMAKYRKGEFHSTAEADSCMSQTEQFARATGFAGCWRAIGPYFCFFFATAESAMFGMVLAPLQYVVRTGDSIWQVCEIPEDVRNAMNDLLQLQERWEIIQQTAKNKSEHEKLMGMSDIKIKAKALGIDASKMKRTECIHAIQKAEGCSPCYGRSNGSCLWTQCCWRVDCLNN